MLRLQVRDGELDAGSWVYAWVTAEGVVYVGATNMHPATRTWLHLHDPEPDVGRLRARYEGITTEAFEVLAQELPMGVDRQQIRHGAVVALSECGLLADRHVCDPAPTVEPHPEAERFVAAIAEALSR